MFRKTRLFTPGPTPLLPAAQFAMAAADVHHRTPEFRALYSKVLEQMKAFIGTSNDVILLTCSGTGAMEASISNLTSPDEEVLVLSAGKFGERWTAIAKAFKCNVTTISKPYGQTFTLDEIKAQLKPTTRVLYMQATETSTGARHDVQGVAKLLAGMDTLLVVDGITGLGTTALDVDDWGIDVLIGGSQKALMIPPGLAYLSVSDRAWKRMESSRQPKYYFDLPKERKAAAKGEASFCRADRRARRSPRPSCCAGWRRFVQGARLADRECRDLRGHDSCCCEGIGTRVVCAWFSGGCGHRDQSAGGHEFG